jgi:hypothetical protein
MTETNVWLVTEEDKKTPQVGDLWVRVSFYGLSGGRIYYKVFRVTPTQIVLVYLGGGDTKIRIRRSDFEGVGGPSFSKGYFYPLTEARKDAIESSQREVSVRSELRDLLRETQVDKLSLGKREALLAAMKSVLEAEEPTL